MANMEALEDTGDGLATAEEMYAAQRRLWDEDSRESTEEMRRILDYWGIIEMTEEEGRPMWA